MFISTDLYLKRLMNTLEQVIAPEIESDHVRGQVFAVIDLLKQLSDRVEYKQFIISQDIEIGRDLIQRILDAFEGAGCATPDDLRAYIGQMDNGAAGKGLALRTKVEEMLCAALNYFHDNINKLDGNAAKELDRVIREGITKIAGRDLTMMKPPMIEKISRSKR